MCVEEGQHLSLPGPPHPSNLDMQVVSEWRGKGGPWVLWLPWKQPIFQSAAVLGVERLPAEAYPAPSFQAQPCPEGALPEGRGVARCPHLALHPDLGVPS